MAVGERRGQPPVRADELQPVRVEDLHRVERRHAVAEHPHDVDRVAGRPDAEQRGDDVRRRGDEPQPRGGHHGERALAADQQLREVVAGVVLQQAGETPQDAAVGEHRLDAHDLGAHRPVPQDLRAARVRRDHAADGRAAARAVIDAEGEPGRGGVLLEALERHPRTGGHLGRDRVDGAERVEPCEREDDLAPARHPRADEPGVAALGHHRHAGLVARRQHLRHLVRAAGPDDERGRSAEAARAVAAVRRAELRIVEDVGRSDDRGETALEGRRRHQQDPNLCLTVLQVTVGGEGRPQGNGSAEGSERELWTTTSRLSFSPAAARSRAGLPRWRRSPTSRRASTPRARSTAARRSAGGSRS